MPKQTSPTLAPVAREITVTAEDIRTVINLRGTVLVADLAAAVVRRRDAGLPLDGALLIGDGDDLRAGYLAAPVSTIDAYAARLTDQLRETYRSEA